MTPTRLMLSTQSVRNPDDALAEWRSHVWMERHGENAMQARPRGVPGLESDCNDAHPPHALNPICAKPR
jgi:hypothetical protein